MGMLSAAWKYRGFIWGSVVREFHSKYSQSMLGMAWMVIHPAALIVVYTVIFSEVMNARLPGASGGLSYSIYLCAGLLTWGLFSDISGRSLNMFIENGNIIKKINFPRVVLPLIVVASGLINFSIIFSLFFIFLIFSGEWPGWSFFWVFVIIAVELLLAIGLGLVLGVLNVFFRDVGQFFGIILQFWFWLTPIVYPSNILPMPLRDVLYWNPMTVLTVNYQQLFLHKQPPDLINMWWPFFLGCALCVFGMELFRRHAGDMVDEL